MFKLGEYPEEAAKAIRSGLDKAGIRSEQRASLRTSIEEFYYKEGRLSELKGQVKDIEMYRGYLDALKLVLASGVSEENFPDLFCSELDPEFQSKRKLLAEALGDVVEGESGPSEDAKNLSGEEMATLIESLVKIGDAMEFVTDVLFRNDIEVGKDVGTKLDDPLLSIKVDPDDYEDDDKLVSKTYVEFTKGVDIYVEELSTALAEELDEEFNSCYPGEAAQLNLMGAFISYLTEPSDLDKVDLEAFRDMCVMDLETEQGELNINGSSVAEDLARALEKGGVLKVKGDKIKWRKIARS